MDSGSNGGESTVISPDEAFSVLGNETRLEIVRTLGEVGFGESLSFTDLRDRVGIRQGGKFNYHLDRLVGHFVQKTEEGYSLRPAGHRVVEAILSGTVTGDTTLEPKQIDHPCPYCGSATEVDFHQQRIYWYCRACPGTYGYTALPGVSIDPEERGYLSMLNLPPAGLGDRDPGSILEAATIWHYSTYMNARNGLCPRCSTSVELEPDLCLDHDTNDGLCKRCDSRHPVKIGYDCRKCTFHMTSGFADWLLTDLNFVAFLVEHGVNPVLPTPDNQRVWMDYDAEIISAEPFEAQFTFTLGDDELRLTVDDDLTVTDVKKRSASEPTS